MLNRKALIRAMKAIKNTEAEKEFLINMIEFFESEDDKEVNESNFFVELNSTMIQRYKAVLEDAEKSDNLQITSFEIGETRDVENISNTFYVYLKNTSVRFKVRDELNKKGYSVSVEVHHEKMKDSKTFLKVVNKNEKGVKALRALQEELDNMKEWVDNYVEVLTEQVENSNLPEKVEKGETAWVVLEEEKRILVKVNYDDMFAFKKFFSTPKWDKELKAWRISTIKSNFEKLEQFKSHIAK